MRLALLLCVAILGAPVAARADSCTVGSNGLTFGTYDPLAGSALLGSGSVVVSCGKQGTTAQISLSAGRSGDASNRLMSTAGGATLRYQLYVDAGRTNPWTSDLVRTAKMGSDLKDTIYVYGAVFAGQDAAVGTYGDAMTITIIF